MASALATGGSGNGTRPWWQVVVPILAATALAVAGWAITTTSAHGERLATVEVHAETTRTTVEVMRREWKEDQRQINNKLDVILLGGPRGRR